MLRRLWSAFKRVLGSADEPVWREAWPRHMAIGRRAEQLVPVDRVLAKAPEGHFITAFRVRYCEDEPAGLVFLGGILDDDSHLAPVGWLDECPGKEYIISAKGCITKITGR